ncbi:MAG TPA: Na+/H+ antiporter NhaA [Acidimicrobiales bacterium]|nr:Na+/H+ antiporter NhaA [Acidimicrobiales bacterium]
MSLIVTAGRSLPKPVRRFLETEAAGGVVLVVAAIVALVWANVWPHSYESLLHTSVSLRVGTFGFEGDLHHFVNDGLMAVFFFVVGLEIKRELVAGDLRDPRAAALPALGAVGGMVVPALLYLAVAGDGGWGIPMATDIAFAVGVLALLGSRVPAAAKLFLLSLAIVDDMGAIAVIAIFYSDGVEGVALLLAAVAAIGALVLRRAGVHWGPLHLGLGVACWLAMFESGVHATIAGVLFGLLTPARPLSPGALTADWAQDLSDEPTAHELRQMHAIARESVSPADRIEQLLHPLSSFVIVPLFALANAGVQIDTGALDGSMPVVAGVVLGLVVGKPLGIIAAVWLGVRLRLVSLPSGVTWGTILGVGAVAGIGFTVSLFVSELAFDDAGSVEAAKLAVLVASLLASAVGAAITWRVAARARSAG